MEFSSCTTNQSANYGFSDEEIWASRRINAHSSSESSGSDNRDGHPLDIGRLGVSGSSKEHGHTSGQPTAMSPPGTEGDIGNSVEMQNVGGAESGVTNIVVGDSDHGGGEGVVSLAPPPGRTFVLEWYDLYLVANVKRRRCFCLDMKTGEKRVILNHLSGLIRPGEFWAIMGPTGCGKTTLLNVLSGRKKSGVKGQILVNGAPPDNNWKRQTAYVLQDDVLFPVLTVYQNMIFQARVRLDKNIPLSEKKRRVENLITILNMSKARDTMIGNTFIRGVSGGERKRVNIGIQLLSGASLLFLDEPTSGLDTSTALYVISLLKILSENGYTIVTTIHQPSIEMFERFDKLLFLVDGNTVYSGNASEASAYFATVGLVCPTGKNPADFVMESVMEGMSIGEQREPFSRDILFASWLAYQSTLPPVGEEAARARQQLPIQPKFKKYPPGYWEQFKVLGGRSLYMSIGSYFQPLSLIQTVVIAILYGLIWLQTPRDEENFNNRIGAIFFLIIFAGGFTPVLNILYSFPMERVVILRERSEGAYPLSAYFLAKVIFEALFEQINPFLFLVISYWMVGFDPRFTHFLLVWTILIFLTWASSGLGLMISSIVYDIKGSTTLATIVILAMLLTSGFYVAFQSIKKWVSWIGYLSYLKYAYDGMVIVEIGLDNVPNSQQRVDLFVYNYGAVLGILIGFALFFRLMSFTFLKLFFKAKD